MPAAGMSQGSTIANRYRLGAKLGQGGSGTVFEAADLIGGRVVAVKVPNGPEAPTGLRRSFAREARVGLRMQHPGVVHISDHGVDGGLPFVVMERLQGVSLRRHCGRAMALRGVLEVGRDLARALAAIHRAGIVHADVKPDNVVLDGSRVVLLDFGLAQLSGCAAGEEGLVSGTPGYMSPEQAKGLQRLPPESDVYSLGCVLYELATGRPPFEGKPSEQMWRHVHETAPALDECDDRFPKALVSLLARMLAKDPFDRPGAASVATCLGVLARDLTRDLAPRAATTAPAEPWPVDPTADTHVTVMVKGPAIAPAPAPATGLAMRWVLSQPFAALA